MDCCKKFNQKSVLYCFPLVFGVSSWLGIFSTFLQMPIIVQNAPEGWSLPSFVVIAIQSGNLGPLLYSLLQKYKPVKDSYLIYVMMSLGTLGALLFSTFYDVHVSIWNQERSLPMLGTVFIFALTACTSSVLFMPYMGRFPEKYIVSYMTGVSCGGLVSSTLTLIQGIGNQEKMCDNNETIAIERKENQK
jgi:riboflavin transporter 2